MADRCAGPAVPIALLVLLAGVARAETIAVLPLQDMGGVAGGRAQMEPLLAAGLRAKGYEVARGDAVEAVLEAERVRHLDSLTPAARERIVAATGASTMVVGTIHSYAEGRNPLVAVSLRAIEAGGDTRWSSVVARSGEDEQGAFGTRTVARDEVAAAAVEHLLSDFPAPGAPPRTEAMRGKPFHLGGPRTWCAATLLEPKPHRVVVLPMEALVPAPGASRAAAELLARRLAQSGRFDVVEPWELRAAMVAETIRSFRDRDPDTLRRLGARLGTTLFLRGTIQAWRDASPQASGTTPDVALEFSLVDVATSRLLWTSQHARKGSDYEALFRRGGLKSVIALADRMFSEMVDAALRASPSARPSPKTARLP